MTTYNAGDIILIPFPFTDFSTFKQRSAVILSSRRFNRSNDDVIIAAITSHMETRKARYEYRLTVAEQKAAGLPKPSVIKLGKIVTIDQRLIRKRIGTLSRETTTRIIVNIQNLLGER